jgi:hypothetical protein
MMRKLLIVLLTLAVIACAIPFAASAEVAPPTALGAPEHFGVGHYSGDSIYYTFGVPEDLRGYIERRAADDPENKQSLTVHFQIDYKIDGGSWHHKPEWDSRKTVPDGIDDLYFTFVNGKQYINSERWPLTALFQGDGTLKPFKESGWDWLKSHSITFRARFAESFDYGKTTILSPWSKEFILSAKATNDCAKLINHAPTLISAEVKTSGGGEPYFDIKTSRLPGEVADLHAMSSSSVRTEVWMRKAGDKEFKYIEYKWANSEVLNIEASDYFSVDNLKQNYNETGYEIKVRYALDLRNYKQSGYAGSSNTVDIYGPFSNVISHNMPAWSKASSWASAELKKADEEGLIPDILKGADMTKPITREEFAELAVTLYEKTTGKAATAASPNPFKDTKNPQILKAFKLGITTGTSATTFAPKELTNREQVAAMLSRAIRVMAPGGDFSTAGAPSFTDKKDISSWALEHVLFMARLEVIKGTDGKFMPKAVTSAQKASGYATTTREQAIAMGVRSFEKMDMIKSGKDAAAPTSQSSSAAPSAGGKATTPATSPAPVGNKTATPTPGTPAASTGDNWLIGTWGYSDSNTLANVDLEFMIEFKADGTFYKVVSVGISGGRSATEYKGKYRTEGNKLILYNQLKSTGPATGKFDKIWYVTMDSYDTKDVPAEDAQYEIVRTADGNLKIGESEYKRGK